MSRRTHAGILRPMDGVPTIAPHKQAPDQGIRIQLVLADGHPPHGRALLGHDADHGLGAAPGGVFAAIDFAGWLGLMAAVGRLVQLIDDIDDKPRDGVRGRP